MVQERVGSKGDVPGKNWATIVWVVLLVGACGAIVANCGMRFWRMADARADLHRLTLERVAGNAAVSSALGKPIELESVGEELTSFSGPKRGAQFVFPFAGPKGKGTLRGTAENRDGKWSFSTLTAEIPGRTAPVDLLAAPTP